LESWRHVVNCTFSSLIGIPLASWHPPKLASILCQSWHPYFAQVGIHTSPKLALIPLPDWLVWLLPFLEDLVSFIYFLVVCFSSFSVFLCRFVCCVSFSCSFWCVPCLIWLLPFLQVSVSFIYFPVVCSSPFSICSFIVSFAVFLFRARFGRFVSVPVFSCYFHLRGHVGVLLCCYCMFAPSS